MTIEDLTDVYVSKRHMMVRFLARTYGDDAMDVLHDAMVSAILHLGEYRAEVSPATWILAIAKRKGLDRVRREGPRRVAREVKAAKPELVVMNIGGRLELEELEDRVARAMGLLPKTHSDAVQGVVEGLTASEVAARYGLTESSIRNSLHSGRVRLRKVLGEACLL